MNLETVLHRFARRIRLMRAVHGLALGATLGGVVSVALAALDYFRVFYTDWVWLAVPVALGAILGAALGWWRKASEAEIAESVDRRAGLRERLSTAREGHQESLGSLQRADAEAHLEGLKPGKIYPWKVRAVHLGPVVTFGAAALIFLAASGAIFLTPKDKAERTELAKKGAEIEKVVKPILESPVDVVGDQEKVVASKMERFAKDLQKGRIPKDKAMQTENELNQQLQELAKKRFEESNQSLAGAQASLEKMALEQAKKSGKMTAAQANELEKMIEQSKEAGQNGSGTDDQMAADMHRLSSELQSGRKADGREMTAEERAAAEAQMRQLQEQAKEMRDMVEQMKKMLASGKDANGKELSKSEREQLQKRMEEMQKLLEKFKLSEELQEWMQKLNSMPEMDELREMMQKMAENNEAGQSGEAPKLTEEDIKKMIERLEALKEKYKDDEAMRELIKELIEAAKRGGQACKNGMCFGLGLGLSLNMPGGPGTDNNFNGTGTPPLNKDGKEAKNAKTQMAPTKGERRPEGEMTYVEVRGPTGLGERTRTPYTKVLPQYKKQAEQALEKEAVPAQHRKRVKDYFDSLQGGGK